MEAIQLDIAILLTMGVSTLFRRARAVEANENAKSLIRTHTDYVLSDTSNAKQNWFIAANKVRELSWSNRAAFEIPDNIYLLVEEELSAAEKDLNLCLITKEQYDKLEALTKQFIESIKLAKATANLCTQKLKVFWDKVQELEPKKLTIKMTITGDQFARGLFYLRKPLLINLVGSCELKNALPKPDTADLNGILKYALRNPDLTDYYSGTLAIKASFVKPELEPVEPGRYTVTEIIMPSPSDLLVGVKLYWSMFEPTKIGDGIIWGPLDRLLDNENATQKIDIKLIDEAEEDDGEDTEGSSQGTEGEGQLGGDGKSTNGRRIVTKEIDFNSGLFCIDSSTYSILKGLSTGFLKSPIGSIQLRI